MHRVFLGSFAAISFLSGTASADFARPPEDRYSPEYDGRPPMDMERDRQPVSTVRVFTGPAIRFADTAAHGGLVLSLDAGRRGAGARFSGAWIRSGSDGGLSQYGADVWIDFADGDAVHPILGAGAAVARLDRQMDPAKATIDSDTIGVGVLRATLGYRLPVKDVDARAALDVVGSVPAVGAHVADVSPWVTAALTVGIGF